MNGLYLCLGIAIGLALYATFILLSVTWFMSYLFSKKGLEALNAASKVWVEDPE